jgi:hypothetical protein
MKLRRALVMLTLATGGFAYPVFADSVSECYDQVLTQCDDALEEARWWEKPAVGAFCAGMMIGCGLEGL